MSPRGSTTSGSSTTTFIDSRYWSSKARLARAMGRNDATVRRLFTAKVNPELRTVAALAAALDAQIRIVPRRSHDLASTAL